MCKTIVIAIAVGCLLPNVAWAQTSASESDQWKPFQHLIGTWVGDRSGLGGDATQSTEWEVVLGGKFIQCKTTTLKGDDPHADIGMISFDQSRNRYIYRSFFSEGFVNQYVGTISDDGKTIEFVTESVENGPPGLRVKEIWKLTNDGLTVECHLASGDEPFERCIVANMKKED